MEKKFPKSELEVFSFLKNAPASLKEKLLAVGRLQDFPKDLDIYTEGDSCSQIAFLLQGEIRVFKNSESGREITLYEIGPGDSCILNASCILSRSCYPANAVTLADCLALMVPGAEFKRLLAEYEEMRTFIFSLLSDRLASIMTLVEEVAFERMDARLENYLLEKSADGLLATTHQKIAYDLGTSREVVSRLLKDMERDGKISLARNEIRVHL